jgi:hypothetical protein
MNADSPNLPPEIAVAFREAKARGLPDGWTCQIDVSLLLRVMLLLLLLSLSLLQ